MVKTSAETTDFDPITQDVFFHRKYFKQRNVSDIETWLECISTGITDISGNKCRLLIHLHRLIVMTTAEFKSIVLLADSFYLANVSLFFWGFTTVQTILPPPS